MLQSIRTFIKIDTNVLTRAVFSTNRSRGPEHSRVTCTSECSPEFTRLFTRTSVALESGSQISDSLRLEVGNAINNVERLLANTNQGFMLCMHLSSACQWIRVSSPGTSPENVLISRMQLGESINPIHTLIYTKHRKTPGQTEMKHDWSRPLVFHNINKIQCNNDVRSNTNNAELLFSCTLFPFSCSSV